MRKLISLALLLVGLLAMSGLASAQELVKVPCGALAAADCALLQQSVEAMAGLKSSDVSFSLVASAENIPDMPVAGPLSVSVSGQGTLSGDMSAFYTVPSAETLSDPAASAAYFQQIIGGLNGDLQIKVSLPQQLLSASSFPIPADIPVNVRLVDGKGYLDFDALTNAFGEDAGLGLPPGWGGVDIVGLIAEGAQSINSDELSSASEVSSELMKPEFVQKYLLVERVADGQVDGTSVAVFQYTLDLQGMLSDTVVEDAINTAAESQDRLTDEQIAAVKQAFNGLTLTLTQKIGLDDHFVRSTALDFSFDMTELMKLESSATEEATVTGPAPVLTFKFESSASHFNGGQTISAPSNAILIPVGGSDEATSEATSTVH